MERATRDRLTGAVILVAIAAILVPEMLSGPGDRAAPATEALADTGPPLTTYELSLDPAAPSRSVRQPEAEREPPAAETPPPAASAPVIAEPVEDSGTAPAPASRAPAQDAPAAAVRTPEPAREPAPAPAQAARATAPAPAAAPAPATSTSSSQRSQTTAARTAAPATPAAAGGNWWVQLGSFSSEENARGLASRMRARGFTIEVSKVRSGSRDLFRVRAGPVKDRDSANALRSRLAAAGQQGTLVAP